MSLPGSVPRGSRIVGLFTDLLGIGGVQEAGRLTASALAQTAQRRGWSVDFLSLNDANYSNDPLDAHEIPSAGPPIRFRGSGRNKVRFVSRAVRLAASADGSSETIVFAAHPHLALPGAVMQSTSPRLRLIVMSHGIEVWKPLPSLRRQALRAATLVLAPSSFTLEKLTTEQGIPASHTRLLAWPLNPSFLALAKSSQALSPPGNFPGGRVILTVGRWMASERYKGADDLIRALAQLAPQNQTLHLVIAGGGDDLPRLRALAVELGVADRVVFLETLSAEEIAACYAHADLFALPSTGEGFGLVFLEAMAFGKPVVGAACGGSVDVIHEGRNGFLIAPNNVGKLADAIDHLLRDESLRTRLGDYGAKMVRRDYAFDVFRARLESLIDDCAAATRP